jgi:hypothetical protein
MIGEELAESAIDAAIRHLRGDLRGSGERHAGSIRMRM